MGNLRNRIKPKSNAREFAGEYGCLWAQPGPRDDNVATSAKRDVPSRRAHEDR
jgi:hypothetical protein